MVLPGAREGLAPTPSVPVSSRARTTDQGSGEAAGLGGLAFLAASRAGTRSGAARARPQANPTQARPTVLTASRTRVSRVASRASRTSPASIDAMKPV